MKNIIIPPLTMPVTEFASQGNAMLGIKGSGKSFGAMQIAEQLIEHGIPFITLDPSGVWRNMKIPAKGGKGFPVVVAHPETGDLPLSVGSAVEFVRAAMRANVSLVIDLYSMKLSKADWRHIVQSVVDVLLYENKGLRHLFIEEAAEFCPQRVGPEYGKVYASIEKLARMGGNASLGYTLINQRAEEVNKAVLEICDCLILFRQKGKNSLISLEKWLTFSDKDSARKIVETLPSMPAGKCWIWPRGADTPTLCQVNAKKSFHPDRQNPDVKPAGAVTDVTQFVSTLKTSLEKVLEDAKKNDPAELRKEIATLKRQLHVSETPGKAHPEIAELRQKNIALEKQIKIANSVASKVLSDVIGKAKQLDKSAALLVTELEHNLFQLGELKPYQKTMLETVSKLSPDSVMMVNRPHHGNLVPLPDQRVRSVEQAEAHGFTKPKTVDDSDWKPGRAESTILKILAIYSAVGKRRLALLGGYSVKGGGFNNAIYSLRGRGLISGQGDGPYDITDDGRAVIGEVDPLPTGEALLNQWLGQLPTAERAILRYLYDGHPHSSSKADVALSTNYEPNGGGFNNAIYHLRGLGLIEGKNELQCSDNFFQ